MRRTCLLMVLLISLINPIGAVSAETLPPWRRDLPEGRQEVVIMVGDRQVHVDLAITPFEQQLGLGYRNGLAQESGMLFIGTASQSRTFWMKGMRFCIDIIWIENGEIVGAAESVCPDPDGTLDSARARFSSGVPVTHVLEMPAGWLHDHGYGPGTRVELENALP